MPKKTTLLQVALLVLVGLLFGACVFGSVYLQKMEENWGNEAATLMATDDSVVELGDGAHTIPITPDSSLQIGDTGTVFDIEITVDSAGFVENIENSYPESEYWFVEFTVSNMSDEIQYGINPNVETRVQYLHLKSNAYIREYEEFDKSKCDYQTALDGFEPGTASHCRFIYVVPSDERNLYWIYARTDIDTNNSYEERYIVFQIR